MCVREREGERVCMYVSLYVCVCVRACVRACCNHAVSLNRFRCSADRNVPPPLPETVCPSGLIRQLPAHDLTFVSMARSDVDVAHLHADFVQYNFIF